MECPICTCFFSAKRIASHASQCQGAVPLESPSNIKAKRSKSDDPNFIDDTKNKGKDAFAVLMSSAKEKTIVETFLFDFLSGSCTWSNQPPTTTTSSTNELRILTNLGRGQNASKVLLIGRNLPSPNATWTDIWPKSRLSIGTLKSIAQKAYRRLDIKAFRLACSELAVKSWPDLIRRLPIILLEDGKCTKAFPALVWLMMAGEDLPMSLDVVLFCINSILFSAEIEEDETARAAVEKMDLSKITPVQAGFVFAMQVRAQFGGLRGDVAMCERFAQVWFQRCMNDPSCALESTACLSEPPLTRLVGFHSAKQVPLAGIDFHCQPQLFETLASRFPRGEFHAAMWRFQSSVNLRRKISKKEEEEEDAVAEIWRQSVQECTQVAEKYVNSVFEM